MNENSGYEAFSRQLQKLNDLNVRFLDGIKSKNLLSVSDLLPVLMDESEKLALVGRDIQWSMGIIPFREGHAYKAEQKSHGVVKVSVENDGSYKIEMPLPQHRKRPMRWLIHELLLDELMRFLSREESDGNVIKRFKHAAIVYSFTYAEDYPKHLYYDFDNVNEYELKRFTDDVAMTFMFGDDPLHAERHFISSAGSKTDFKIYVMDKSAFLNWYNQHEFNKLER